MKLRFLLVSIALGLVSISHEISHAGPYYEVRNSTSTGVSTMTLSGHFSLASSTSAVGYRFRIDGPGGFLQFPDGSKQYTAGGGGGSASTIAVNSAQFSGDGGTPTPLNLVVSSVTLQGNTFNGLSQLVRVESTGFAPVSITGNAYTSTTTTNLAGGGVGYLPYQSASGVTNFINAGTANYVLGASGGAPQWVQSTSANVNSTLARRDGSGVIYATAFSGALYGTSDFSNDLTGGAAGSIPYQAAANNTSMLATTTAGYLLTAGAAAPTWTNSTSANTGGAVVVRDGSGNFSAGTVTAALAGNATTATTATNFSGSLSGDVTGTQGATVVGDDTHRHNFTTVDVSTVTDRIETKVSKAGDTMTGGLIGTTANYSSSVTADGFFSNELNKNAGLLDTPTISSLTATSITVGTSTFAIYTNDNYEGHLYVKSILSPQVVNVVTGNNIVYIDWNGGTPIYAATTDDSGIDWSDCFPVADIRVRSDGTIKYQLNYGAAGHGGTERNIHRVFMLRRFERESGLSLSEAATRKVAITAGVGWFGNYYNSAAAFDSNTDPTYIYTHDSGGNWIEVASNSYNNTWYDTPTGTATLTANRYAVNWIYRNVSGTQEVDIVLGTGDYTLAQAQSSTPQTPPPGVQNFYYPVGRIIVQRGAQVATSVENFVSGDALAYSATGDHNDLIGIQGGAAGEYYHLTATQQAGIILSTAAIVSRIEQVAVYTATGAARAEQIGVYTTTNSVRIEQVAVYTATGSARAEQIAVYTATNSARIEQVAVYTATNSARIEAVKVTADNSAVWTATNSARIEQVAVFTATGSARTEQVAVYTATNAARIDAVVLSTQALSLATHLNTASTIVKRDGSGNFSAGTITGRLSGNATTATTATNIAGGTTGAIPYEDSGTQWLAMADMTSAVLSGSSGALPVWTIASSTPVASSIVKRDTSGNFSGGTITATTFTGALNGNAATATTATTTSGNAATATALAADPADCSSPQFALGINASGTANCATVPIVSTATLASRIETVASYTSTGSARTEQVAVYTATNSARIETVAVYTATNSARIEGHIALTDAHSATAANTVSRIVLRDGSGNFSAGTITANTFTGALNGNAATATTATTATNIAGGGAGQIPYQSGLGATAMLAAGTANYILSGNGAGSPVWTLSTTADTVSTLVRRDASGNFSAKTISATSFVGAFSGTVSNADLATKATNIAGGAAGAIPRQTAADTTAFINAGSEGNVLRMAAGVPTWLQATSSNDISAVVVRDGSGNFSAGTITASLTGASSLNVLKAGDTMTGGLVTQSLTASSLTVTGDKFSVGTSTFVVANGKTAIGDGAFSTTASNRLTVSNAAGDASAAIFSGAGSVASLYLGSSGSPTQGGIQYYKGTETLNLLAVGTRLSIAGATGAVTIPGSSFSVGTSTFVVKEGRVRIGAGATDSTLTSPFTVTDPISYNDVAPVSYAQILADGGNGNAAIEIRGYSTGISAIEMSDEGAVSRGRIRYNHADDSMQLHTAAGSRLHITSGGNVGIGTTSPASKLDISSGSLTIKGTGAGMTVDGTSNFQSIISTAITLGGVARTAWPTADAVLSGTQTWTGQNTFTKTVTISSAVAIGPTSPTAVAALTSGHILNHWQLVIDTSTVQQGTIYLNLSGLTAGDYMLRIAGVSSNEGTSEMSLRCNGETGTIHRYAAMGYGTTGPGSQASNALGYIPLTYDGDVANTSSPILLHMNFTILENDNTIAMFEHKGSVRLNSASAQVTYTSSSSCDSANPITYIQILTRTASRELGALRYRLYKAFTLPQ